MLIFLNPRVKTRLRRLLCEVYTTQIMWPGVMTLFNREIKSPSTAAGLLIRPFQGVAVLCSVASDIISSTIPSTSPCPLWQLLAYLPIQHVMRKLTDRLCPDSKRRQGEHLDTGSEPCTTAVCRVMQSDSHCVWTQCSSSAFGLCRHRAILEGNLHLSLWLKT